MYLLQLPQEMQQKWTYITVSVDNSYVDSYLDGKLVKSIKIEGLQSSHTDANVYLGGKVITPSDIQVSNFLRWTNALTPQDVWNEFNKGNGGNWLKSAFSQYGLDSDQSKSVKHACTVKTNRQESNCQLLMFTLLSYIIQLNQYIILSKHLYAQHYHYIYKSLEN